MTRILWADDQQDVIQTLSGLLSAFAPSIIQVKDGTEALNRLKSDYFDVLILDLMMPPNTWGGLWLLEEIRKSGIRIPVLVLSGEGTQNETIKALRLGAKDFVTKDKVQDEFLRRVRALLKESAGEIDSHVTKSFPTPLALPYSRYLNTTAPVSQLRRLVEFYESSLRLSCIVGICELGASSNTGTDPPDWGTALLYHPSMGAWNRIRRALAEQLGQNSAFFQIHNSFYNKSIDSVIELRNEISHGGEPSKRFAQEQLNKWEPQLRSFVSRLWHNMRLRFFLPLSLQFSGSEYQVQGYALIGDSVALHKLSVKTTKPIICEQPHLITEANSVDAQWVNLFPFISVEPALEPNAWQILVFDSLAVRKNLQALTGDETIRYIDVWTGRRNVTPTSKPTSSMLPDFLAK